MQHIFKHTRNSDQFDSHLMLWRYSTDCIGSEPLKVHLCSLVHLWHILKWMHWSAEPSLEKCYFERIHLSINKDSAIKNNNWTMCGRSFLISSRSDSYLNLWIYGQNSTDSWRTTRYDDRQSPRNKASKIQKLAFRCFLLTSAKAKKFQDGDRSIRLYTTISLQLRRFSKIATIVYQKDSRSFQRWVQREAKRSILQDYELTDRQTDRHTHTHTHTDRLL